jgi:hypothetical protein
MKKIKNSEDHKKNLYCFFIFFVDIFFLHFFIADACTYPPSPHVIKRLFKALKKL